MGIGFLLPKVPQLFVSGREVHGLYSEVFLANIHHMWEKNHPNPVDDFFHQGYMSNFGNPADLHHERRVV